MTRHNNRHRHAGSHSRSAHQSKPGPPRRRPSHHKDKLPAGVKKLPYYDVPDQIRDCLFPKYSFRRKIENLQHLYPSLFHEPTPANYVSRMRALIFIEEVQENYEMEGYDMDRAFLKKENDYYRLEILNLSDRRPTLVIGGSVLATSRKMTSKGTIISIEDDGILLKYPINFMREHIEQQTYKMKFICSRFNFRKQHYSVVEAHKRLGAKVLFPTEVIVNRSVQCDVNLSSNSKNMVMKLKDGSSAFVDWFNPDLNTFQKLAIKNILRGECRPMPYVIFGPPGTGKTFTILEAVLQIIKLVDDCQILIGTTSNSAADLLTDLLINSDFLDESVFVRVVSHNYLERDMVSDSIKPYCATLDLTPEDDNNDRMFVTNTGMKLHCQLKHLKTFKVIISTCSTLGNFHQMNFEPGHFTHVLIDEAGQCTEPECLIPVSMVRKDTGQIILVGDPMQLGPNVHCKIAMSRGLEDSFLVRLLQRKPYQKFKSGYDGHMITKLLCNYRSIPSILKPYNDLFYNSELISEITRRGNKDIAMFMKVRNLFKFGFKQDYHGVYFFNVMGTNQQDLDSPSWYNPTEARCINLIVQKMLNNGISVDSIGIITPYNKQVLEIQNTFGNGPFPKIGTVEEFQGHEFEIILISTVRSITPNAKNHNLGQALGFVRCPRRMNVAVSRARSFLMVFGDADLLSMHREWERFINYCQSEDGYINMNQSFDFYNFLN